MSYFDEFQNADIARGIIRRIQQEVTRRWTIMEVCGGQTHSIVRAGIDQLLHSEVELVHGPG
ncbi:MAG: hypothetical protein KDK30_04030, partial [Leptospiraceae bacterium]|nr:hypothetical protein [Leptospiraceae bacterium]